MLVNKFIEIFNYMEKLRAEILKIWNIERAQLLKKVCINDSKNVLKFWKDDKKYFQYFTSVIAIPTFN